MHIREKHLFKYTRKKGRSHGNNYKLGVVSYVCSDELLVMSYNYKL
jgi:hypothetical protein